MNMLEFERDIARRTLSFLDNKSTQMADHILEDPTSVYSDPELFEEEKRVVFGRNEPVMQHMALVYRKALGLPANGRTDH